MSASSSMRRAVLKAQGLFEPRRPARGTTCIQVRSGFTGRVKGPRVSVPLGFRKYVDAVPESAPAPERRTLAALAKGVFRGMTARLNRARGGKD